MNYYSLTIKCNLKKWEEDLGDLTTMYGKILDHCKGTDLKFEVEGGGDSEKRLHIHCYFKTKRKLKYTDYRRKGYNVFFRRVYEHTGWMRYLQKDLNQHNPEQDELIQKIQQGEYLFRDE